eukprot:GFUD01117903.1.p1 GENE.GFUD01117903.1~~GFUD01117903.1.p1  ORF type:complete len:117 (-),score=51.89 GFUD01117903.1:1-351(-)
MSTVGKRSTRGVPPKRFEAYEDDPHDLMSRRKRNSDKNLGKDKAKAAKNKKIFREYHKVVETEEVKEAKKKKETERKIKQRQKKKQKISTLEEKSQEKAKEAERKRIYRAKKKEIK